jgi:hypothetical protein
LGIWQGQYKNMEAPWLRWWDAQGNLLLSSDEKSQQLSSQLEEVSSQLEQEQQKAERLAQRLRQLGIEPDDV